jgi:transcriptional regulator with XRE-family HTH domain
MIGDRIKRARLIMGISQEELAATLSLDGQLDKAELTADDVKGYEGNKTPSSDILISLARALNVKTEYFFRISQLPSPLKIYIRC